MITALTKADDQKSAYKDAVKRIKECDTTTYGHCKRVGKAAALLGKALGKSDEECLRLKHAGTLHDIGKIKTPDSILNKEGKLTTEERFIMNEHVSDGVDLLKKFGLTDPMFFDAAGDHHAWYQSENMGYRAQGNKGKPSDVAQIMAIVDVYDALANKRAYKDELDHDVILDIMQTSCEKGQFNPDYYNVFEKDVMPVLEAEKKAKEAEERMNKMMESAKQNVADTMVSLDPMLSVTPMNTHQYSL